MKQTLLESR